MHETPLGLSIHADSLHTQSYHASHSLEGALGYAGLLSARSRLAVDAADAYVRLVTAHVSIGAWPWTQQMPGRM